ncbi:MAG: NUDIX domain-containing protein [Caldilineaceae bacterium]|nr:NUDIX domain-containing protein [Caldilineaceae bacterium]
MKRLNTTLLELIHSIRPYDALEEEQIEATLGWIASGAPLYRLVKPDVPIQHLVAYFALFDPVQQQLLLVDHKKAGLWLPSGGHVEPDEPPQTTVQREAREELGIEAAFLSPNPFFLTVTQTVGHGARHSDVSLWYLLRGDCSQTLWFDVEEFHQIAWFALDQLPLGRCEPHLARFVAKLRLWIPKQ